MVAVTRAEHRVAAAEGVVATEAPTAVAGAEEEERVAASMAAERWVGAGTEAPTAAAMAMAAPAAICTSGTLCTCTVNSSQPGYWDTS